MIFFSGLCGEPCNSHTVYATDAVSGVVLGGWTLLDNRVNQPEFLRIIGRHEGVTIHDFLDLLQ